MRLSRWKMVCAMCLMLTRSGGSCGAAGAAAAATASSGNDSSSFHTGVSSPPDTRAAEAQLLVFIVREGTRAAPLPAPRCGDVARSAAPQRTTAHGSCGPAIRTRHKGRRRCDALPGARLGSACTGGRWHTARPPPAPPCAPPRASKRCARRRGSARSCAWLCLLTWQRAQLPALRPLRAARTPPAAVAGVRALRARRCVASCSARGLLWRPRVRIARALVVSDSVAPRSPPVIRCAHFDDAVSVAREQAPGRVAMLS